VKRKVIVYLISLLILTGIGCTLIFFRSVRGLYIKDGSHIISIYIPTGSTFNQVLDSLNSRIIIRNQRLFSWLSRRKNYQSAIKPGHYIITGEMSYLNIINILRAGNQTPVKVTFNNIRTLYDLAGKIGSKIEADSVQIIRFLTDNSNYEGEGFTRENVISVFIPNTYDFYWNTDAAGLFTRMLKEYHKFWNEDRLSKAKKVNLTPVQVSIIASIVDDEVAKAEEKPRIAGVYLNRLKKDIPLQACPSIKFALNDFSITRILSKHLLVDSPYNTYRHKGFPPGPIGCPTIEGINSVLNAEKHEFLFFAAKPDFSGYHNFSKTLAEHNRYAALYQKELDKRKIFR
jgi:UPF0755 protein